MEEFYANEEDEKIFNSLRSQRKRILILGGLGFVGKNFFEFVMEKDLFEKIVLVDKSIPLIAHIRSEKKYLYEKNNEKLVFLQRDLTKPAHLEEILSSFSPFDHLLCFASETRPNLSEDDYRSRCFDLPLLAARFALLHHIPHFVLLSSAKVYKSSSSLLPELSTSLFPPPSSFSSSSSSSFWNSSFEKLLETIISSEIGKKLSVMIPAYPPSNSPYPTVFDPWDPPTYYQILAEKAISMLFEKKRTELNQVSPPFTSPFLPPTLLILRPALIYGSYDYSGEMGLRLSVGVVYRHLKETLKLMWDEGLGLNTIWVGDVVRGVLYAMEKGEGGVFNLVDENETNLKKLNALISALFQIKSVNIGSFRSYLLQWTLDDLITVMNEKHLTHWFKICHQNGVDNSPLNIISNKFWIQNKSLCVDGRKFRQQFNFKLLMPKLEIKYFMQLIKEMQKEKVLPSF